MKITRINQEKGLSQDVKTVDIQIGIDVYRMTEEFGKMRIHLREGSIAINPGCANEILISNGDTPN